MSAGLAAYSAVRLASPKVFLTFVMLEAKPQAVVS